MLIDNTGVATTTLMAYGPFGEALATNTNGSQPTNPSPATPTTNASDNPMGWAANPNRKQESLFSIPIIQMGARVYLPTLGRFLQNDPVRGGTANAYVYVGDPVNKQDYSGEFALFAIPIAYYAAGVLAGAYAGWQIGDAIGDGINYYNETNTYSGSKVKPKSEVKPDTRRKQFKKQGVYKFTDATQNGKTYIGKSIDIDRRMAQHNNKGRITPGTFQVIAVFPEGTPRSTISLREQLEINLELQRLGSGSIRDGILANKINGIAEKNWDDCLSETLEFGIPSTQCNNVLYL